VPEAGAVSGKWKISGPERGGGYRSSRRSAARKQLSVSARARSVPSCRPIIVTALLTANRPTPKAAPISLWGSPVRACARYIASALALPRECRSVMACRATVVAAPTASITSSSVGRRRSLETAGISSTSTVRDVGSGLDYRPGDGRGSALGDGCPRRCRRSPVAVTVAVAAGACRRLCRMRPAGPAWNLAVKGRPFHVPATSPR